VVLTVWKTLTTSALTARWLMPNDFAPVEGGTRLRLLHAGFRSPGNDFAFNSMSPGWARVLDQIERVIAAPA
jgi:hypothetical protein